MLPILIVQDVVTVWAYRQTWDRRNRRHPVPGAALGILAGYRLRRPGLRRGREARGRHDLPRFRGAQALGGTPQHGGRGRTRPTCRAALFWGALHRLHEHDRPCGRAALPDLCACRSAWPGTCFVGTGADPVRAGQLDQGPALPRARAVHATRTSTTLRGPVPARDRLDLGRRLAGASDVSGERFYTVVYYLLIVVGLKLIHDGLRGAHRLTVKVAAPHCPRRVHRLAIPRIPLGNMPVAKNAVRHRSRQEPRELSAADAAHLPGARGGGLSRSRRDHPRPAPAELSRLSMRAAQRLASALAQAGHQTRRHGGGDARQHARDAGMPLRRADDGRGAEHPQHPARRGDHRLLARPWRGQGRDHRPRILEDHEARARARRRRSPS